MFETIATSRFDGHRAGLPVLLDQPLHLSQGVPGDFHQVAGDDACIGCTELVIPELHQSFPYPPVSLFLAGSHTECDGLGAIEELSDGVNGSELFQAHDRFHPPIMNEPRPLFRLI